MGPDWAQDGSFLVFRRLRQDVGGFHRFLHDTVDDLRSQGVELSDPPNASAIRSVGSKLVGRWPSGAPVARTSDDEAPGLGDDDCKNNYFEFQDNADALPPFDPADPAACLDDGKKFPLAEADASGIRCPFTGHIRKTYPRDDRPLGIPNGDEDTPPSESSTQTHRLLRRGLPYGPVSSSTPEAPGG